jgi:hypothetical protein
MDWSLAKKEGGELIMKIRPGSWVLIVILVVTLIFALSLFSFKTFKVILVPAIACGLILVLGAEQLRRELIASRKTDGAPRDRATEEKAKQTGIRYLIGYGWLVGVTLAIYLIGFIYSTFLFLLFVLRFTGKHSWLKSSTIAILGTALFWVTFVYWLQSDLWGGAIFNWFDLNWLSLTTK